jgi:hypothetical protein
MCPAPRRLQIVGQTVTLRGHTDSLSYIFTGDHLRAGAQSYMKIRRP